MSKRTILIFSTAYYPFVGGAEIAIKEITDRLGDDFDFHMITARFKSSLSSVEKIGNITVYRVGFGRPLFDKLLLPLWGAYKAWQLHTKYNYMCFWGMMVTYAAGAGYIVNTMRMFLGDEKIPMILTLQEGDSEDHLQYKWAGLIGLSWKLALWQTDILTGISNFLIHRAERFGFSKKSFLIPNGVDLDVFSHEFSQEEKKETQQTLGKKEGDVFLVTTSRLVRKNAVDDTIRALQYLPKEVSFIVIGVGDEGQKLSELAREIGVSSRVKFLGFLPHNHIPKYVSVCDIFVRPSRSEGFGNSFIEAMAVGIPVIATPVGGIVDFVHDKETGIFCAVDNPQSIAEAVKMLIGDRVLREYIVSNARQSVQAGYSWTKISSAMKDVFKSTENH